MTSEYTLPGSLFHYQGPNIDWVRSILLDHKIWFSNPASFNDPWDCRPTFSSIREYSQNDLEHVKSKYDQVARHRTSNRHARRNAITKSMKPAQLEAALRDMEIGMGNAICNEWGIYCLSKRDDIPLLWAHYALSHQGVCLEFSTSNEYFSQTQEVHYSDHPNFIKISDSDKIAARKAFLTKASYWSYEDECRLILPTRGNDIIKRSSPLTNTVFYIEKDRYSVIPPQSLIGIIFGAKTGEEFKNQVRTVAQQANWQGKLYQATVARGSYEIVVKPAA